MDQYIEVDGSPATTTSLGPALSGYGHFTYMQVRARAVRGLDLHLDRLTGATRQLFGAELDIERTRAYIRHALEGADREDASVRVQIFPGDPGVLMTGTALEPRVMVMVRPPAEPATGPQRLRSVEYERLLPHLKHLDTMGLIQQSRRARHEGFDDALLTDRAGHVTEAALANLVLVEDRGFVWPDSPALPGVMRGLLRRGMARLDVPVRDRTIQLGELSRYSAAFLTNSISPAQPVASVDSVLFSVDASARSLLHKCYETNAWDRL